MAINYRKFLKYLK